LLKTKWWLCAILPTRPNLLLATFFFQTNDLKLRHFADVAEVHGELLAALDSISIEDLRQCFQQWKWHWNHCIQSQGEYFEGD
jgi:hypothetical protein